MATTTLSELTNPDDPLLRLALAAHLCRNSVELWPQLSHLKTLLARAH